jgi:hypothetical protein
VSWRRVVDLHVCGRVDLCRRQQHDGLVLAERTGLSNRASDSHHRLMARRIDNGIQDPAQHRRTLTQEASRPASARRVRSGTALSKNAEGRALGAWALTHRPSNISPADDAGRGLPQEEP